MIEYYKNQKGKRVGRVSGDTYYKNVKKSKHYFWKWDAWAIDRQIIDGLVRSGVNNIVIHETEEDKVYTVSVKDFVEKGIEEDFGHGKQLFLPIINFVVHEANQRGIQVEEIHNLTTNLLSNDIYQGEK